MRRQPNRVWQMLCAGLLVISSQHDAVGDTAMPPPEEVPAYPEYADERLVIGRGIWLGTCEGCHGYGIAGSPRIGDAIAWQPRIAKGKNVLYAHALEGFFGKGSTHMPPRGGNEKLTDDEVRAAVDYMVAASSGTKDPGN